MEGLTVLSWPYPVEPGRFRVDEIVPMIESVALIRNSANKCLFKGSAGRMLKSNISQLRNVYSHNLHLRFAHKVLLESARKV